MSEVTLRDHIESRFAEHQRLHDTLDAAHEKMHRLELRALEEARAQHLAMHLVIEKDMAHLNELRQEVVGDRNRFVLQDSFREFRGQVYGAIAVFGISFAIVQFVIAYYRS